MWKAELSPPQRECCDGIHCDCGLQCGQSIQHLPRAGIHRRANADYGGGSGARGADGIVLPGVGAFPDAWSELQQRGLPAVLRRQAEHKPILGICLGMQLLMTSSTEVHLCRGFISCLVR